MTALPFLVALAFRMPSGDELISMGLLLAVLALAVWIVLNYVVRAEPARQVGWAIFALVLVVVLLQTFTSWGG